MGDPTTPASATPTYEWFDVCSVEEIPDKDVLMREEGGEDLIVYRDGGQVMCVANYCPHRGWTMNGAKVRNGIIMCPVHGYEFRLDTGECVTDSCYPLYTFPVRIRDARVEVQLKIRSTAPETPPASAAKD